LKNKKFKYYLYAIALIGNLIFTSCGKEETDVEPPRNFFSGVMDGTAFANTSLSVFKDTSDIFTMIGGTGNGITLIAFVNGRTVTEYPITQGVLLDVSELLDQTISLDSAFIDSIQTLITEGINNLPVGECFAILFSNGEVYYSNRGGFTLTNFNGVINRIDGLLDFEMVNIPSGTRYVQAFFEDVYYIDCPGIGLCIF
jgi:hypothetical protein